MKFGPVPLDQALGAVLAHSVVCGGKRLRKGQIISADDVAALQAEGLTEVIVARLDETDMDEDSAAALVAQALAGEGVSAGPAGTGRVNLTATGAGIAQIDADAIAACNAINPMITVATVPPLHRVDRDTMLATIKIISYGVPKADARQAARAASNAISVLPPRYQTATLIETQIGATPTTKGEEALRGRLERLGMDLQPRQLVAHTADAISAALQKAAGDVLFVLTASATSDIADVGPSGVRHAGGTVTQFGMPVDPGNLLFLGDLDGRPVIGLPGCARSPALNGADWVIERVVCGVTLTPADFAQMGVGGLLKEIPTRPQPRAAIRR